MRTIILIAALVLAGCEGTEGIPTQADLATELSARDTRPCDVQRQFQFCSDHTGRWGTFNGAYQPLAPISGPNGVQWVPVPDAG